MQLSMVRARARRLGAWLETPAAWNLLLAIAIALSLLPIALVDVFPSQDGSTHVYNASLLTRHRDPANYLLRQYYEQNPLFVPNLLVQLLLSGLLLILTPLAAEKALVMLIVASLPLALDYLARAFDPRQRLFALVGLLFGQSYLLHMGFYAFVLAVPLGLVAAGYWLRHRTELATRQLLLFNLLALATFLCHFAAYAMLLLLLAALWLHDALLLAVHAAGDRWLRRWPGAGRWLPDLGARSPHHLLRSAAVLAPICALGLSYAAVTFARSKDYWGSDVLGAHCWDLGLLTSFTHGHLALTPLFWATVAAALAAGLGLRLWRRQLWDPRDSLLLACAGLFSLYWSLPWTQNGGGWVNVRLLLPVALLAMLWCGRLPRPAAIGFGGMLLVLSALQLQLWSYEYRAMQPELQEFQEAAAHVAPHSTVELSDMQETFVTVFGSAPVLVNPLTHAAAYLGMRSDVVVLDNYAAAHPYFPFRWRFGTPRREGDYVVVWRPEPTAPPVTRYDNQYDLVHQGQHLLLYRRKQPTPDLTAWAQTADGRPWIELRLGNQDKNLPPGVIGVASDDACSAARPGWFGPSKLQTGAGPAGAPEIYRTQIGSEAPATLRLALADGRYRVTVFVGNCCAERSAIDLVVAGAVAASGVELPGQQSYRALRHEVEVVGERLDLAFATRWKASNDPRRSPSWAVSAIRVEQIPAYTDDGGNLAVVALPVQPREQRFFEPGQARLASDRRDVEVRYTVDGSPPTADAMLATGRIAIDQPLQLRAQMFKQGRPIGEETGFLIEKPPVWTAVDAATASPGWRYRYVEGSWSRVPALATMTAKREGTVAALDAELADRMRNYALQFDGFIELRKPGRYTFWLSSDDGSVLRIGDQVAIDNNPGHQLVTRRGTLDLAAGVYPIQIAYFQAGGTRFLRASYRGPGMLWRAPIEQLLWRGPAPVR